MKIAPSLRLDSAARLILLRQLDPLRKWESLDDRRFCRCCHKFISGRQIEVTSASGKPLRLVCPTTDCSSTVRDWVYPNEIAQPPDSWGRRVLRVVDKSGESFIACEKPYSRRRTSGSTTGQSRVNATRSPTIDSCKVESAATEYALRTKQVRQNRLRLFRFRTKLKRQNAPGYRERAQRPTIG
jgi:hypothetical protein